MSLMIIGIHRGFQQIAVGSEKATVSVSILVDDKQTRVGKELYCRFFNPAKKFIGFWDASTSVVVRIQSLTNKKYINKT